MNIGRITQLISLLPRVQPVLQCSSSITSLTSTRKFTESDVNVFAQLSGDANPIHIETNQHSRFPKPVVHGTLVLGQLSGMIAKEFSGALLYKLNVTFKTPLFVDEEVNIVAKLTSLDRTLLKIIVNGTTNNGVIFDGSAEVAVTKEHARKLKKLGL